MEPIAHSAPDGSSANQPLDDHLRGVAKLAGNFANTFAPKQWGHLAGLWHDIGKFSHAFQRYIRGGDGLNAHMENTPGRVDHSTAGALHAQTVFEKIDPLAGRILAYCIAGHHAGLADWHTSSGASLARRLAGNKPVTLDALVRAPQHLKDQPPPPMPPIQLAETPHERAFQAAFYTRMVMSCLVDADFLDTERFMDPDRAVERHAESSQIEDIDGALHAHLTRLQSEAEPTEVNLRRGEVLDACLSAAENSPGLFSLTVPTGGGKTLSSLAFALKHARTQGLDRVIYAIPFTSIIEQNADVFRGALGDLAETGVLEHHSNMEPKTETPWSRLTSQNWDAPLVVTTNVQFFESLFASRTSRCRKLHNIANSVIILDEAQTLPVEFLKPCLSVLRELVRNYRCTIVLCTATQPAIHHNDNFTIGLEGVREIIPAPEQLYMQMKRVRASHAGTLSNDDLAGRLAEQEQVLCIVNTKRHAVELYKALPQDGATFHLSTLMCPRHRSVTIRTIKRRLKAQRPCRVVSTQLIEAGVDIDFPVVYRAAAGLDSIAQAAGRCNREGRLDTGEVYVFDADELPPPGQLRQTAQIASEVDGLYEDLLSPEAIKHYFDLHYWQSKTNWDKQDIMRDFKLDKDGAPIPDFRTAAKNFRLIPDATEPVIVPWKRSGRAAVERLRRHPLPDRKTRRALQRLTVQIRQRQWEQFRREGLIELVHEQFPVLTDISRYSDDTGLSLNADNINASERFIQ